MRSRIILQLPENAPVEPLVRLALRRGFQNFVLAGPPPEDFPPEARFFRLNGPTVLDGSGEAGPRVIVEGPSDLERAVDALRSHPFVLVEFAGEQVIPLENLLARRQDTSILWVRAEDPSRVPGLLGALERGSDAVVVPIAGAGDLERLEPLLEGSAPELSWTLAQVRRVAAAGLGERVIVDTTSLLSPTEGLLGGSQGAFLVHLVSEAVGSRYTRPRPFRVNAGAVHSYTLLFDGETRYLAELEAGDRVLVATPRGTPRPVRVGRLKIERRPLTLVELETEGDRFTIFAQEAETVRLSGDSGPIPITELTPGQSVWGVRLPPARHFGTAVTESILER